MNKHNPPRTRRRDRDGYTVIELLVVIVIAVLLLTIAVPAFQSTIYSSNRSLAVNALQASSVMARDVAVNTGKDGAVVFVYDPDVQRINIIPAIKVGTIREPTNATNRPAGSNGNGASASGFGDQPYFDRDVFVPAPIGEVLNLPANWMVRGYASPGTLIDFDSSGNEAANWYNSEMYGERNASDPDKDVGHWVFPETGFFPRDQQVAGGGLSGDLSTILPNLPTTRQSFMIRFDARTGAVSRDTRAALFVDPRNSRERPYGDRPNAHQQTLRIDLAESIEIWASRLLDSSDINSDGLAYGRDDNRLRAQLIGTPSNDTILVKPVSRLALYDETKLAIGIGARGLNKATNSLYEPQDQRNQTVDIKIDLALFPSAADIGTQDEAAMAIDRWIDGDTNGDGRFNLDDEPDSRLFLVQSYTGELKEVLR